MSSHAREHPGACPGCQAAPSSATATVNDRRSRVGNGLCDDVAAAPVEPSSVILTRARDCVAAALLVACPAGPQGSGGDAGTPTSTGASTPTTEPTYDTHAFGPVLDMGQHYTRCDLAQQDCPEGQKCNPSALGTGSVFSGARICVPEVPDAKPPYAPCSPLGSTADGTDDCELGSACLGDDVECRQLCNIDGQGAPPCPPEEQCFELGCAVCEWGLCRRPCDPREPTSCPVGDACLPGDPAIFHCVGDLSGDDGQAGDPCEFLNNCDPGLLCVTADQVPGCDPASISCCVRFCSTDAPNTCPNQDQGATCLPFFTAADMPLPQFINLGTCTAPTP